MSKEAVSIKGTQDGLIIQIEETAGLSEMIAALQKKLTQAKGYFDDAKVALEFSGKSLSETEKHELLEVIRRYSKMEILSVGDHDKNEAPILKEKVTELSHLLAAAQKKGASFHNGTLRSGQSLSVDTAIVILGDVNNGAIVNAGSSAIILGKLRGVVNCGLADKPNAFVFALEMRPTLLQINNVYGRFENEGEAGGDPMIAYIHAEQIAIEPLSHSLSKNLEL